MLQLDMKERRIGGYLNLEIACKSKKEYFANTNYLKLKSGRASLNYIIKIKKPTKIYVPFYTCDSLLEPILINNVDYSFYNINSLLELEKLPSVSNTELIIYINYFDLKREYVHFLSGKYNERLIVDNTMAFFMKPNGKSYFFNSCRKFLGVPDGSYLFFPELDNSLIAENNKFSYNQNYILEHLILGLIEKQEDGYKFFRDNETLVNSQIEFMSIFTEKIISCIDLNAIKNIRKSNFKYLHKKLGKLNRLSNLIDSVNESAPLYYPLTMDNIMGHEFFWENNIFMPKLWDDCLKRKGSTNKFDTEKEFVKKVLPLPIDQRYNIQDMAHQIDVIKKSLYGLEKFLEFDNR
jgi:hypothetical protein